MKQNINEYDLLIQKLKIVRRIFYTEKTFKILFESILIVTCIIVLVSLAESLLHFSVYGRTILFSSIIILTVLYVLIKSLKLYKEWEKENTKPLYSIALMVGEKYPNIKDRLRNALDIYEQNSKNTSNELSLKIIEDLQKETSNNTFSNVVSFLSFKKLAKISSGFVIISFLLFSFSGVGLSSALVRIINYDKDFQLPNKFIFKVIPGDIDVVKGETIKVNLQININPENLQPNLNILPSVKFNSFINELVSKDVEVLEKKNEKYETQISNIRTTLYYYFEVGGEKSATYRINVTDKPLVRLLNVKIIPPSYTNEESFSLEDNVGDVSALLGSTIIVEMHANKLLKYAEIMFQSGEKKKMTKNVNAYQSSFILNNNSSYTFELVSNEGIKNEHQITYSLTAISDKYPSIEIISPKEESTSPRSMIVPVELLVWDDYGITNCKIGIKLIRSDFEQSWKGYKFVNPIISNYKKGEDLKVYHLLDLSKYSFAPNDVVEFYAEVTDNDEISGPKIGKSKTYTIRFPSIEEVFSEATKQQTSIQSSLEQTMKEAENITKEMNELLREVKQRNEKDWQKEKAVESLKKKMSDLESKVEKMNKEMGEMADNLQKEQLISPETVEKYMELQQMLKNLNSEEYMNALQRLQENMKGISQEQLNQVMKKIELNDETFRASIERTLNLLKRISIEQKVDELSKRADELLQKQIELEKQADSKQISEEQALKKQNEIQKQLESLKKETDKLQSKMEEFPAEMPLQTLEETKELLENKELQQSLEEAMKNISSSQMEKAASSQRKSIKQFQKLSEQFSKLKNELLESQTNQVLTTMQKAVEDLLELSQRQEKIKKETEQVEGNSSQYREKAQEELSLESNLQGLMQSLAEASQKSFKITSSMGRTMGDALREMMNAVSALEQRNGNSAVQNQKGAMTSLNKSANLLQKAISDLQQQGESGGMSLLQQFRQMMGEQQLLNIDTEEFMRGRGLTKEQMEGIGQLAAQQEKIRKSLQELSNEAAESKEREKLMGNTQSILDEMKEVVKEMSQQQINSSTVEKQHKILSRMLDVQRSMQERDYEEKRNAITATDKKYEKNLPIELKQLPKKKMDLIQLRDSKFTKEYKELIRSYYEQLQKEEKN